MQLETVMDDVGPRTGWPKIERLVTARRGALTLACIVLASLAFRMHVSNQCSFWLDEVLTHLDILEPWSNVLAGSSPAHPPLMYVLVKLVMGALGEGDTALRSVSLLFGCVLLVATHELCLQLRLSVGRSLLVVATLACSPFFIRHAVEARHYAIVMAFTTLATTRALRCLYGTAKISDLIGFWLSASGAAWTHYFGLAYSAALVGAVALGCLAQWKQAQLPRRVAWIATLGAVLMSLGWVALRAVVVNHRYAADPDDLETAPLLNTELLREIPTEFSFITNDAWALVIQPLLVVAGLTWLSLRLRGVARLLPFGIGLAPCVAALFLNSDHFLASRYLAPSFVWYHLGACLALFTASDLAQRLLARSAAGLRFAPFVGYVALAAIAGLRAREFPEHFGAGLEDYKSLQRYFVDKLANDTRLVTHVGAFGQQVFGKRYRVGSWPIALERFRQVKGIRRYLIAEVHSDGPERRKKLESLVRRYFGISPAAFRALPLLDVPHSRYQPAVKARLVEIAEGYQVPAPPRHKRRRP